jgi:hypothetical protein
MTLLHNQSCRLSIALSNTSVYYLDYTDGKQH